MSLHNAVFGKEGVGAGLTPYSDAAYFGSITHPTGNLVELMARVAVRLGVPGSTQTSAMWRLDQAMGGGKSHGLIGLWHLAAHPQELAATDLGTEVMAAAENIAGKGSVRADLGNPDLCCLGLRQHNHGCGGLRPCEPTRGAVLVEALRQGRAPVRRLQGSHHQQGEGG